MFHVVWLEKRSNGVRISHTLATATTEDRAIGLRGVYARQGHVPISEIVVIKKPTYKRGGKK